MSTYARILSRVTLDSSQFNRELIAMQRKAQRVIDRMKNIGGSLTNSFTLPLSAGAGLSLNAYKEYDALKRALDTQEVSAEALKNRLEELRQIAKAPGIGFREAIEGDVRLRAIGISAKQSAKIMKEFANAIALTGGGRRELNQVTVQLGQMASKGQVFAQDLKPIIESAPVVGNALRNMFGVVDSESIQKILKDAGKSSTDFINDLLQELSKAPRVTGGFKNSVENMEDALFQFGASIGESIDKTFGLTGRLQNLADKVVQLGKDFTNLPAPLQKFIVGSGAATAAAGPLLYTIGKISESFIGNGGFRQGARVIGQIGKGLAQNWKFALKWAIVAGIIVENIDNIKTIFQKTLDTHQKLYTTSKLYSGVVDFIVGSLKTWYKIFQLVFGVAGELFKIVGSIVISLGRLGKRFIEAFSSDAPLLIKLQYLARGGLTKEIENNLRNIKLEALRFWDALTGSSITGRGIEDATQKAKDSLGPLNEAFQAMQRVGEGLTKYLPGKKTKVGGGGKDPFAEALKKYIDALQVIKIKTDAAIPGFDNLEATIKATESAIDSFAEIGTAKAISKVKELTAELVKLQAQAKINEYKKFIEETNVSIEKIKKNSFLGSGVTVFDSVKDQVKELRSAMEKLDTRVPEQAEQWKQWNNQALKLENTLKRTIAGDWTVEMDFDGDLTFFDRLGVEIKNMSDTLKAAASTMMSVMVPGFAMIKEAGSKAAETAEEKWQKFNETFVSPIADGVFGIWDQLMRNRGQEIDNYYEKEKAHIESSNMSEADKAKAIQKLDEETAKKRRKLAREEAKQNKLKAIFDATIAGITAVVKALPNVALAGVVGALAAAQVAAIAAQPLPALAKGGLAYGPSLALVGDNPRAGADPEVIAPLSKLKNMLGDNSKPQFLYSIVRGNDLYLLSERQKNVTYRTRG